MEINSNTPKPNSAAPQGLGNAQRPGEYLRQIRLSQRKELAEVAQELKIPEKQLMFLEKDDYKALPEAPFIKGYYRTYAKFLNTDATLIIQRFDEIYSNDTGMLPNHALKNSPIKIMGKITNRDRRGFGKWIKRLVIVSILALIAFALVKMISGWSEDQPVNDVEILEINPAQGNIEILPLNTVQTMSGDQLALEFVRPTSVMIQDSTGKTLAQGRQSNTLSIQGQAPFSIRIDETNAVKLKLNSETINLGRYTNASGSADFRLSP